MKRNVPVSKIMTANPFTVHFGMKLTEVSRAIETQGFHHVPIVSGKKLLGMLSSTDLMRVTYDYGQDDRMTDAVLDHTHQIAELMTSHVVTIAPDESIRRAFELLAEGRFHALPVVDGDELVGIVTSTDLLRYALEQY